MTYIRHILDIYEKRFSLVYTAILACNHVQPNGYTALCKFFLTKSREISNIKKLKMNKTIKNVVISRGCYIKLIVEQATIT